MLLEIFSLVENLVSTNENLCYVYHNLFSRCVKGACLYYRMAENTNEMLSPDNSDDQLKFRDPLISGFDASDGEVCILKI